MGGMGQTRVWPEGDQGPQGHLNGSFSWDGVRHWATLPHISVSLEEATPERVHYLGSSVSLLNPPKGWWWRIWWGVAQKLENMLSLLKGV